MEAHLAHNQEYVGSCPTSATLLLCRNGRFRVVKFIQNKPSNRDKAGTSFSLHETLRLYFLCSLTENTDNLHYTFYSRATASEYGVLGGRIEICAVLTQKCGADYCFISASSARTRADLIIKESLKLKNRDELIKRDDSKSDRMAVIGFYSKGRNGQMYTLSFILMQIIYILLKSECKII